MHGSTSLVIFALLAANPPAVPGPDAIDHDPADPLIYGGELADPGEWPAVVAVRTNKLCTGTLVAPNLVLTAAHCFDPAPFGDVEVTFGDSLVGGDTLVAQAWGSHPGFCLPSECGEDIHDFAWLELPGNVAIEPVSPITDQAEFDEVMIVDQELWFVGFGEDEDKAVGEKREVAATLTSFNESGREFRAGGEGKDTCLGDSGGPALVQLASGEWRLAGVISRGGECGMGGIYGVPLPELCWLRDDSGVDLLPGGCEQCDCVELVTPVEDEGCGCALEGPAGEGPRGGWILAPLSLLLGAGAWRRRRRG